MMNPRPLTPVAGSSTRLSLHLACQRTLRRCWAGFGRPALLAAALAVGAAGLGGIATPASAQFGGEAGFRAAFMPDYLSRDINLFTEYLVLEEWQKPIVEVLLEDYQTSFRAGEADFRNKLVEVSSKLQASGQQDAMKTLLAPFEVWETQKAGIAKAFEDNVKLQLGPDQAERWPALERALRREKWLSDGVLSGESVDLILVSKQVEVPLDVQRAASEAFVAYELALDEALMHRHMRAGAAQKGLREAMTSGDSASGVEGMKSIMEARVALRNMQDQQTVLLADALGAEWGPRFAEAARKASYPKAFRPRLMLQVFDEVLAIESLTPEQTADVQNVLTWYTTEMDTLENALVELLRTEEPEKELATVNAVGARARGEEIVKPADTFRTMAARRESLSDEAVRKLSGILTPTQIEEVPGLLKRSSGGKGDESAASGKNNNRFSGSDSANPRDGRSLGSDGRAARAGSRGGRGGQNNPPSRPSSDPPISE